MDCDCRRYSAGRASPCALGTSKGISPRRLEVTSTPRQELLLDASRAKEAEATAQAEAAAAEKEESANHNPKPTQEQRGSAPNAELKPGSTVKVRI